MRNKEIYSAALLSEYIQEIGFLPLLGNNIAGFSAEEAVTDDCRYVVFPDGGWDWPLWKWKGPIVQEGGCVYGKFFNKKAGFIARKWWPDFYNVRRYLGKRTTIQGGSIEEGILETLQVHGSLITRELRKACGFDGPKMRSKFDSYVTGLQMGCHIVTEDFIYPTDRHGNQYGWGWSLLTTPESLLGREACTTAHVPEESFRCLVEHLRKVLPQASEKEIATLINP